MPSRLPIKDQALALLYHARNATLFFSNDGEPCASVPTLLDARHVYPLRSAAFRDWVTANFYKEYEIAPSLSAYRAALRTLEARAHYSDMPAQKFDVRLGFLGDPFAPSKILLDLANEAGEVLEINSHGWRVSANLRHCFRQSSARLALPPPEQSANPLDHFAALFRLTAADRARTLAWLLAALRPVAPYPVLVVRGPAVSGKSCLVRALRALIDPSAAPLRRLPPRDHDLLESARQNWMLTFDHVHRAAPKIADALCAVSSGDALEIPQPDFRDPLLFQIARPVALIAPSDETQPPWTPPRALSNRTLAIQLAPLPALRPEAALWSQFEALRPPLLGALADAVVTALQRVRDIDLGNVARFPDCAAWTAAAAPALSLTERDVVGALTDPDAVWIGADPLRDAIYTLLRPNSVWTGDATALLHQLRSIVPLANLPPTPKALSQALPGIAGIHVAKARGAQGHRTLAITRTAAPARQTAAGDVSPLGPSL
ncbi:MAG TPA: hypothetical protein VEV17_01300 [Bryobacteraceae bacterium]|nr:hypothetical protein [Bryobacteraceae bacterium]